MAEDIKLDSIAFIPRPILTRLLDLEIYTIRQLFARLQSQADELEDYLELSAEEFASFRRKVNDLTQDRFPEDDLPRIYPTVNKRGVAVHRLDDSSRPRFFGRK
ncbi:MAG: hypothetical protein QOG23_1299 [Blastocatellia bacterium]|jgi:hypothetical protein|nr:hypothetical protein [Blastocatellia bacterium]